MKFSHITALASSLSLAAALPSSGKPVKFHKNLKRDSIQGFDISHYQPSVDFGGAYSSGARFVIIKATEGTDYIDPSFSDHYDGATSAGFIRGGYHFARPDEGDGATQAKYFFENGGGWTADGITLPGMLDIEYATSGNECYDLSNSDMVSWIADFVNEYHSLSGRYPIIYSTNDWWSTCTGDATDFSDTCPLSLASYNSEPGTIPGGWPFETFWQYNDAYSYGGDSDIFNGDSAGLSKMATG